MIHREDTSAKVTMSEFDGAVQEYLREYAVPKHVREARVSERLRTVEPVRVPSPWGELCAWRLGSGPAVLLVHGWQDDNSLWSPLIDALAGGGRSLVAFDLPGHGASGGDWGVSFEGTDAIVAVANRMGPIDAVVAHSAGCGMSVAAIGEGWRVECAALIAPPLRGGDRWRRYADRLGMSEEIALAAKTKYFERVGASRAAWSPRTAYRALDIDVLVVHSRDDEHSPVRDVEELIPQNPHARLELVDGLTHRRTARDPTVIDLVSEFVSH
jgi:pimeloyl-ACP methyl ester carboxylesterase